jgi:hypothetical protein
LSIDFPWKSFGTGGFRVSILSVPSEAGRVQTTPISPVLWLGGDPQDRDNRKIHRNSTVSGLKLLMDNTKALKFAHFLE